jgi:hypothetical protein
LRGIVLTKALNALFAKRQDMLRQAPIPLGLEGWGNVRIFASSYRPRLEAVARARGRKG